MESGHHTYIISSETEDVSFFSYQVKDVESILKAGYRMKAVARVVAEMEKAKKENMGPVTSNACVVQ